MRKYIAVLGVLSMGLTAHAQTPDDVELFSQRGLHGTPRFTAMGGAFTSLGNDMSALHLNPASIGVFRYSELSLSLAVQNEDAQLGPFYGSTVNSLNTTVLFENVGLGLQFGQNDNKKSKFGLGISFNKIADFDRSYSILGFNNPYTIGEFLGESSATFNVNAITDEAYAAYEAYLLVDTTIGNEAFILDNPNSYAYGRLENGEVISNSDVRYTLNQIGSLSETALTFGGQYNKDFYYGVSLGFPTLTFRREEFITEYIQEQDAPPYNATEYTFRRLNDIYGNGFNFKLGFIYTPVKQFRIGASYQSPSWYTVNQFYEFDFTAQFNAPPFPGVATSTQSQTYSTNEYSYRLRTPSIWRLGVSTVLGSSFIASLDYQFSRPTENSLYTNRSSYNIDASVLESYQTPIQNLFTNTQQALALGLEYKYKNFFLRGGYRWDQSPYQNEITDITVTDRNTISTGAGMRFGPLSLDVSYVNSSFERDYVTYSGYDLSANENVQVLDDLQSNVVLHNVVFGVTYKF